MPIASNVSWPDVAVRPEARADLAACRAMLANGSRTFLAASYLLPRAVRDPACALYAFCRVADDAIDAAPGGDVAEALALLRRRLDAVYSGGPPAADAVDRAFAGVVRAHAIPRALPEALLEGFAWDVSARRYETLADLHDYAARVAGTVGAMMALVMGATTPSALARACDLGVAMQLSNIARDVGEDAAAGRVYLPLTWLREAGLDVERWLAAPRHDARLAGVVARVLDEAERLYARAAAGIAELPLACRVGINAARLLYAEIGREVARRGFDAVASRAVVPGHRKAVLLARAAITLQPRRDIAAPPLAATRALVDAASVAAATRSPSSRVGRDGRIVWLLGLYERLERQDRLRHAGGAR